jgi:xylan 1,4-beta-xylosidase
MGSPKALSPEQVGQLNGATRDAPESDRVISIGKSGAFKLSVPMCSR